MLWPLKEAPFGTVPILKKNLIEGTARGLRFCIPSKIGPFSFLRTTGTVPSSNVSSRTKSQPRLALRIGCEATTQEKDGEETFP